MEITALATRTSGTKPQHSKPSTFYYSKPTITYDYFEDPINNTGAICQHCQTNYVEAEIEIPACGSNDGDDYYYGKIDETCRECVEEVINWHHYRGGAYGPYKVYLQGKRPA